MKEQSDPISLLFSLFFLLDRSTPGEKPVGKLAQLWSLFEVETPATAAKKAPIISLPVADSSLFPLCRDVLRLSNEERAKRKLQPLLFREDLNEVANAKAVDIAVKKYFSHRSPTYGSPFDFLKRLGISYRYAGENLAKGQSSAQEVVKDWMRSPGHRKNILFKDYSHIGIGVYPINQTSFVWTQLFWG